ncbi:MAG: hypothetical protein ACREFX_01970 [Opitutaceae bacterium]
MLIGGALMIAGDVLWERLGVRIAASPLISLASAGVVMVLAAVIGLGWPLRRAITVNNDHLLRSDLE